MYFKPWDWVIGTCADEEEMRHAADLIQQSARQSQRILVVSGLVLAVLTLLATVGLARNLSTDR